MKSKSFFKQKGKMLLVALLFAWFSFGLADEKRIDYLQDPDQDGLTTAEELAIGTDPYNPDTDGDGYTDSVEVESGYDPLKPAPGDKLIQKTTEKTVQTEEELKENVNLTDQFIEKLKKEKTEEFEILNNKKDGEINSKNISLTAQDVEKLAQQVMEEASLNNSFNPLPDEQFKILAEVKEKDLKKKKEKEKSQIEQYLTTTGFIVAAGMPFDVTGGGNSQAKDFINSLNKSIEEGNPGVVKSAKTKLERMLEELKQVETPFVLKDLHIRWVSLLNYLINLDGSAIFKKNDPIAMSLLAGQIQAIINETKEIEADFSQVIEEYSIGNQEENNKKDLTSDATNIKEK